MRKIVAMLLVFTMILGVVGCGRKTDSNETSTSTSSDTSSSTEKDDEIVIGMVPKVIGTSYFEACAAGAVESAQSLGVTIDYRGPTSADAAAQVNIIQDMIFKKVDILAVSPIDSKAVEPTLKQAQEAGILVVTYDADVDPSARSVFVNQVSGEALGRHLMDNVAEGLDGKGEFAILTASLTAQNQNTWIEWMKLQLEEVYPDMILAVIIPTEEDQHLAFSQTQNLIHAYPEIKGIVALSTISEPGAARAIEQLGLSGEIKLYGLALPNDMRGFIKSGVAESATLWDPERLGKLVVEIAYRLYNGESLEDGMMTETSGQVEYDENTRTVIMGQPLDFTVENIDDYDF